MFCYASSSRLCRGGEFVYVKSLWNNHIFRSSPHPSQLNKELDQLDEYSAAQLPRVHVPTTIVVDSDPFPHPALLKPLIALSIKNTHNAVKKTSTFAKVRRMFPRKVIQLQKVNEDHKSGFRTNLPPVQPVSTYLALLERANNICLVV